MTMSIELTITIRDEEKRRLSKSFLLYEAVTMSEEDPYISECLKELLAEFKGEPDDIKIKAEMILR
jgi:hypothetical protein